MVHLHYKLLLILRGFFTEHAIINTLLPFIIIVIIDIIDLSNVFRLFSFSLFLCISIYNRFVLNNIEEHD